MQNTCESLLTESLSEALETMAFIMVMPPAEEPAAPQEAVQVTMQFTGPKSGTVELMAGKDFLIAMAANVLGVDPGEEEAQAKGVDAFREILNTTCGVLLPKLASSPADVFNVTLPEDESFTGPEHWQKFLSQEGAVVLDADGSPLACRLVIR